MAVITPRNGATLAQVVQTALNVAGRTGVSIETGGTGNGVRVPDAHLAAIEAELGWTEAEGGALLGSAAHGDTQLPADPPTPATTQAEGSGDPDNPDTSDPSDSDPDTQDDTEEPAAVAAPAKKTTSSRRARRGKEG